MRILVLDLGTKTGWAAKKDDKGIISGTIDFKNKKFDGAGMRYLKFKQWLTEINHDRDFDVVYYEAVRRHIGTDAAHAYGGYMATLTSWCEHHDIPYTGIPVGTIKKHATGKGNANKQMMIDAAIERGFNPIDDNEADALALLSFAMKELKK